MSQSRILINISKAFWNKIPDGIRYELLEMALDIPGLSARSIEGKIPAQLQNYIDYDAIGGKKAISTVSRPSGF